MNSDPVKLIHPVRLLALVAFLGLSALALATLFVSRGQIPEVSGSPTPPEFQGRTVVNVLSWGDFVTRAPDGEAHVLISYNTAEAFRQLVHAYDGEVWPQYRIVTAAVLQSDDGTNWTTVAEASELEGKIVFDLGNAGAHRFWKVIAVKSGDAPEVVFGHLSFVKSVRLIERVPVDAVWLALVPASLLVLRAFGLTLSLGRVFASTAIPVTLFVLLYTFGYAGFHTVIWPDSATYLQRVLFGTYSESRNHGYSSILLAVHDTIGLDYLALFQFGIGIVCYLTAAFLLAVRFGNKWFGSLLVLALLLQGTLVRSAPEVLTEALFMAGLTLFAAALGALAWRPDKRAVIAASVGIVLATLAKTIGVVLVVPALLLVRFLPKGHRLSVSGAIVVCGLGTYALMAVSSYVRTGVPTPERFAGFALIGHVGWMLDDTSMPPSDLTQSMIKAVAPVIAQRPPDLTNIRSLDTLDRYVNVTTQEYNILLWQKLLPAFALESKPGPVDANAFFLRFGFSSIRAHPLAYLRHVAAHFYGLWRDLREVMPLRNATVSMRQASCQSTVRKSIPPSVLAPCPSEAIFNSEQVKQLNLPLALDILKQHWILRKGTIWIGALALFLSILILVPGRLAWLYRTEIMIALSLNAYFGAHVLLQVTLERYAFVAASAATFMVASFVVTSCCLIKSMFALRDAKGHATVR